MNFREKQITAPNSVEFSRRIWSRYFMNIDIIGMLLESVLFLSVRYRSQDRRT